HNSATAVARACLPRVENLPLYFLDPRHRASTTDVFAESVREPNCIEANIPANGHSVVVRVEREFAVVLIAATRVCVAGVPGGCSDPDGKDFDFAGETEEFDDLDDLMEEEI